MDYNNYSLFDVLHPVEVVDLTYKGDFNLVGAPYQKQLIHTNYEYKANLKFSFECISLYDRYRLLEQFYTVRGGAYKFLIRSYKSDFILAENASAGDTTIKVKFSKESTIFNYHQFLLYIEGQNKIYKVVSIDEPDPQYTVLHLDDSLQYSMSVKCADIEICYLGRWKNDTLYFEHDDIKYSMSSLEFEEVAHSEYEESL